VAQADANGDRVKNNIASAYEGARASFQETYTRKNKTFAMILSFVVVLALNASLIRIYETLAADGISYDFSSLSSLFGSIGNP
jgi:hypothetical protein